MSAHKDPARRVPRPFESGLGPAQLEVRPPELLSDLLAAGQWRKNRYLGSIRGGFRRGILNLSLLVDVLTLLLLNREWELGRLHRLPQHRGMWRFFLQAEPLWMEAGPPVQLRNLLKARRTGGGTHGSWGGPGSSYGPPSASAMGRLTRSSTQRFQKPLNPFKEGYDKDN